MKKQKGKKEDEGNGEQAVGLASWAVDWLAGGDGVVTGIGP